MGNAGPKGPALLQIVVLNSWERSIHAFASEKRGVVRGSL